MRLYFSPGACSLASHIALRQAKIDFDLVKVDLKAKTTEAGEDFNQVNPKGYVPALAFKNGPVLTENIAVLSFIAQRGGLPGPAGEMGHLRLLETLAFISTEIHKSFKPFFTPDADAAAKVAAKATIERRLAYLAQHWKGDYLFGKQMSVADAYLFVMLLWAQRTGVEVPAALASFAERMQRQPAVEAALKAEGLA